MVTHTLPDGRANSMIKLSTANTILHSVFIIHIFSCKNCCYKPTILQWIELLQHVSLTETHKVANREYGQR